jgi:transcriptional regulator with XRE-family HTH domain
MTIKDASPGVVSRDALQAFMDARGLKPHPWAKAAGLRSSTIYNFIAGRSHSLTYDSLQRLARAAGVSVDELVGGRAAPQARKKDVSASQTTGKGAVALRWLVGIYGRLFPMDENVTVDRPVGLPQGVDAVAARIDGDGLHPIPADWLLFFSAEAKPPDELLGKLCVVRVRGATQPLVREIRRGSTAGLFTLLSWGAAPMENVEVVEAHPVLSITQA